MIIPPAPAVGTQESAGFATQILAALTALNTYAQMSTTVTTPCAASAFTPIVWAKQDFGVGIGSSAAQGLQVATAGDYEVSGRWGYTGGTGRRLAAILINGSSADLSASSEQIAAAGTWNNVIAPPTLLTLAAGAWINLYAYHTNTASLNIGGWVSSAPAKLTVRRVG